MPDDQPVSHERVLAGRYALYGPIPEGRGAGGMTSVSFGRLIGAAGFSRTVAIKRLRRGLDRPDLLASMLDDARVASRIVHPNVVATLDLVQGDDTRYLVMEYVAGEALSRLLSQLRRLGERVDVRCATGIMAGVLHGLHAAHEARGELGEPLGVVHGDISPRNVLCGTDGLARLLDFGGARGRARKRSLRAGQIEGKVGYMAPEQILGEEADRQTDMYAAAVVLWELLTGRRLFPGKGRGDDHDQIPRILEADIVPPSTFAPDCPRRLDGIVMRGLNRDPRARYPDARGFAIALEEAAGVATPREIGDLVARVAADALDRRARELAAIERASVRLGAIVEAGPRSPRRPFSSSSPGRDAAAALTPGDEETSGAPRSSSRRSPRAAQSSRRPMHRGDREERTTVPSPSWEGEPERESVTSSIGYEEARTEPPPSEPPSSDPASEGAWSDAAPDGTSEAPFGPLSVPPSSLETSGRRPRLARSDRPSGDLAVPVQPSRLWILALVVAVAVVALVVAVLR